MYEEIQRHNSGNIKGYSFELKKRKLTIQHVKKILKMIFTFNDKEKH